MDRYKVLRQLGDGTYGSVWKAVNRKTGEVVAIKRMKRKFFSWEECLFLREVRSLRKLRHPCIVKLNEVVRENNELFFIFEYLDYNLYQLMKHRKGKRFTEAQVRDWMFQILQGLDYMHNAGFFHRDLKPENLLVHGNGEVKIVKIADFGLAREIASEPPYTEYVSTRWYRAPEVLFKAPKYSAPVDLFAVGAIMAELFTLKPLFPGATEFDEIMKIRIVIGSFTTESWPEGEGLLQQTGFQLGPIPDQSLTSLADVISEASPAALDLIAQLVQWDPSKRPTAAQALAHPFFKDAADIPRPATPPILQERSKAAVQVAAETPLLVVRKDSKREMRRESSDKRLAADLSSRHDPKAVPTVRASRKIDYNPMKSSIRISERQRRASKPHKGRQQSLDKVRSGQPPDLWVNAQGMAKAKQHAGFSQIERGAPMGAPVKTNPWLSKSGLQAPFASSVPAQPLIPAHRKAVPVRTRPSPAKNARRTSEAGLPSLQQGLNARLTNDSQNCRMAQLQVSTLEVNRYAPLSASMAQWDESTMPALRKMAASMAKAA